VTLYVYRWKNNEKRATLYGRTCRVVTWGSRKKNDIGKNHNSALVEFENGQREIISRNALRRVK